jgi:putative endonuclease
MMKKQLKKSLTESSPDCWHVYIIRCADDTLYTGISNDVEARIQAHNQGKGAKYTQGRGPVLLLATWTYPNKSQASKAEYALKKMSRSQKLLLISGGLKPGTHTSGSGKKK